MPSSLSVDLRERVVAAVGEGASGHQASARFGISVSSVSRWSERFRLDGQVAPKPSGGDNVSQRIETHAELILAIYEAQPQILLRGLRDVLAEQDVQTSTSSLSRFLPVTASTEKRGGARRRAGAGRCERGARGVVRGPARA